MTNHYCLSRKNTAFLRRTWLLLMLSIGSLTTVAQTVSPDRRVTLGAAIQSRQQAIESVQSQTPYKVLYNPRAWQESAGVNFDKTELTLSVLLDKLTEGTGQTYSYDGNFIIIHKATEADDSGNTEAIVRNVSPATGESGGTLHFQNRTLAATTVDAQTVSAAKPQGPIKTTAYFIRNETDHTIRAFSEEAKSEYSFVPSSKVNNHRYMPWAAVKTNLLWLATTSPNLAAEFGLARKWTLDISAVYNPFQLQKDGVNRFGLIQPEIRYWFCQRFEKHFIGLHGLYGRFNIGQVDFLTRIFETHRYKGWGAGAGLSYGYHLPMGRRWAWEFTVGAGYVYLKYDQYRCYDCDEHLGNKSRHYFGPTKAGISLMFMIK